MRANLRDDEENEQKIKLITILYHVKYMYTAVYFEFEF